jgi:hypothetical protein
LQAAVSDQPAAVLGPDFRLLLRPTLRRLVVQQVRIGQRLERQLAKVQILEFTGSSHDTGLPWFRPA